MIRSRSAKSVLAPMLIVLTIFTPVDAAWTIASPTKDTVFSIYADVGASGTADANMVGYTLAVKTTGGVILNSTTGNSYGMAPGYYWNGTVTTPSNGSWPSAATPFVEVAPTGGTAVSVEIKTP